MKKLKIRIDGDNILVDLPYKNGMVTWSYDRTTNGYMWRLCRSPNMYQPSRVRRAHNQRLTGTKLQMQIMRYAAASHNWEVRDRLIRFGGVCNRSRV